MLKNISANERLIVALDVDSSKQAIALVETLGDEVVFYKIGWQLFIREGMDFVNVLINEYSKKVFLDLKMTDIEETIRQALRGLESSGIELLTIHGNGPTVRAAIRGRNGSDKPRLLMLTALSSQDDTDMRDLFSNEDMTIERQVTIRASQAINAGCEGLIASGDTIRMLREKFGNDFIIVAPGIRPKGFSTDDHKRSLTPYKAILDGADYLVVGRPISQARDPKDIAHRVIGEIQQAMDDLSKPQKFAPTKHPGGLSYPAFA